MGRQVCGQKEEVLIVPSSTSSPRNWTTTPTPPTIPIGVGQTIVKRGVHTLYPPRLVYCILIFHGQNTTIDGTRTYDTLVRKGHREFFFTPNSRYGKSIGHSKSYKISGHSQRSKEQFPHERLKQLCLLITRHTKQSVVCVNRSRYWSWTLHVVLVELPNNFLLNDSG